MIVGRYQGLDFVRGRGNRFAHLLFSTILSAAPAPALAQSRPLSPPTREEVTRRPRTPPPTSQAPRLEVEGGVERAPCALAGPEFQSIHFVLKGAEFDGLQGLTREQIANAYAPYVGHDIPISTVCEIRDRAGTILRNAGYIAAVQVPEQRISDGTVRFTVLMAHLTQIRVRGDATGAEKLIAGYLGHLTREPVFNRYEAERYLLLASDLPGYTVRLILRPAGTTPGEVVGDVTVQRDVAYADFNVQNAGSDTLGPWGGLLRGEVFGLTGLGDRTTASVFSTADFGEEQTLQLAHDFRLGSEGLTIGDAFTYSWAKPSVPNARILARTLLNTFEVGYPFERRQAQTIRGSAGLDYINQSVELDGLNLTRDRMRDLFVRLGIDSYATDYSNVLYSPAEPPWRLSMQLELRQGLHVLGATDCGHLSMHCLGPGEVPPSRLDGQSDATIFRYTAYGEYRPIPA
jgi:hemolysin activation/secretion protein